MSAYADVLIIGTQGLLSPTGRFYLVAVKQNDIQGICRRMLERHSLEGKVCLLLIASEPSSRFGEGCVGA